MVIGQIKLKNTTHHFQPTEFTLYIDIFFSSETKFTIWLSIHSFLPLFL